jgi:hypothetical protein
LNSSAAESEFSFGCPSELPHVVEENALEHATLVDKALGIEELKTRLRRNSLRIIPVDNEVSFATPPKEKGGLFKGPRKIDCAIFLLDAFLEPVDESAMRQFLRIRDPAALVDAWIFEVC